MRALTVGLIIVLCGSAVASAQDMPPDYAAALKTLNKTGDFKGNVLKANIPRNDLTVAVAGVLVPIPLGFGGWVAMTKGEHGMDVMMGDLVLTESEVNPVMSAVLERRPRRHGAAQSFPARDASHVLHACARRGHGRRTCP